MTVQLNPHYVATGLVAADERLTEQAAKLKDTRFEAAVTFIGKLGDQPELRILSSLVLAAGLLSARPRMVRAGARMLFAHEVATLAKDGAKNFVDRTRPRSARHLGDGKLKPGESKAKEESSFPSGHSAGAIAVARAFAREFPEHAPAAVCAALMIGAAQVPRDSHYPSDILAGFGVGIGAEAAVNAGWKLAERKLDEGERNGSTDRSR